MTTRKLLWSGLIGALPLLGIWGLAHAYAQDQRREDRGGQPVAVPGDRDPNARFDGRGAGQPPIFDPSAPNAGDPGLDSGAPRDPNAPRRSRGEGRGMPPGRGQFGPGSPMPSPFGMRPNDPEMEK